MHQPKEQSLLVVQSPGAEVDVLHTPVAVSQMWPYGQSLVDSQIRHSPVSHQPFEQSSLVVQRSEVEKDHAAWAEAVNAKRATANRTTFFPTMTSC